MSIVRAKFYVSAVTHYAAGNSQVVMAPVCRGAENKQWAAATPAGSITMTINNPQAVASLVLGSEFYVDFTPAETAPRAGDGHAIEPFDAGMGTYHSWVCGKCGLYAKPIQGSEDLDWSEHEKIYAKTD